MKNLSKKITLTTLLLAGVTGCSQHHFPIHEPETILSVADDPKGLEKWVLQDTHLPSKESIILALVSERKEADKRFATAAVVYIDSRKEAKNILFINSKNNKSSWLFNGNNQLIIEFGSVSLRDGYMPFPMMQNQESKALYYKIVGKDSNGDGKITALDSSNLAVSDMLGKNYKVLVEGVSHIVSVKEMDNSLIFVYQKRGIGYSMQVSLDGFKVLSNNMLPKVGQ